MGKITRDVAAGVSTARRNLLKAGALAGATGLIPAFLSDTLAFAQGAKYQIGVSFPTLQEERWQKDYKFFEKAGKETPGLELIMQVANNDADKQFSQIENMMTQGVKAIIVGAVDTGGIAPVINKAHDRGIIVVAYARLIHNAHLDLITLFNQYQDQELAVKYALSLAPKGNYVLLAPDRTTQPEATLFEKAWHDNLQPYVNSGAIKIVLDQYNKNWAPEEGMANMENALTKAKNDVSAVLCANDGIAGGAIQALTQAGLAGKVVVTGNDSDLLALKRIIAGTQSSTIFYNTDVIDQATLDATINLLKGQKIDTNGTFNNGLMDVPALQLPINSSPRPI